MFVDSHAHIHFEEFRNSLPEVFTNAQKAKVETIITVGTDDVDSRRALEFVTNKDLQKIAGPIKLFASAGIHPHEASLGGDGFLSIKELTQNEDYSSSLVAIGECGLDYYKNLSSPDEQREMLCWQIELALECDLPLIFHVRDAWDDFFDIIQHYPKLKGVIHSFTGGEAEVQKALNYNLYFGLNGIITFTREQFQLDAVRAIPKDKIVLETDCPFLAPAPMRGKQNEPSYIRFTAEFIAKLRHENLADFTNQVLENTDCLFKLEK